MTLIELLMTLSIVAIAVGLLASSNFRDSLGDVWMWSSKSTLVGCIQLARSESVTHNKKVGLCASSDGATCSGVANDGWKGGAIMFTDLDGDNDYDGDPEKLLRVCGAMPDGQQITASNHAFVFSPDGTIQGIAPAAPLDPDPAS